MPRFLSDSNFLYSIWKDLKNVEQKFSIGLLILNNTLNGHKEVFQWLLIYHELTADQCGRYVEVMVAYTVNVGTCAYVTSYLEIVQQQKRRGKNNSNCFISSLLQVC